MTLERPTVVIAGDPEGGRHVLFAAARRSGDRPRRVGLSDLRASIGPRPSSLGALVGTTRIDGEAELCDLFAHLVDLPRPDESYGATAEIDVRCLDRSIELPSEFAGPLGRRFLVQRGGAPAELDGRALLFANARASGGPWWAPVGDVPREIALLGALLQRAERLGVSARSTAGADRDSDPATWFADLDARGIAAADLLGGLALETDGSLDAAREWSVARYVASALADLERAARDTLFPYWFLLFDTAEDEAPLLEAAVNARRWLAGRADQWAGARVGREAQQ